MSIRRKIVFRTLFAVAVGGIVAGGAVVGATRHHHASVSVSRPLAPASVGITGMRPSQPSSAKVGVPIIRYAVPAISPPVRDLGPATPTVVPRPESFEPAAESAAAAGPAFPDPAVQTVAFPAAISAPIANFDGLTNRENFTVSSNHNSSRPPDNHGDVGPNHYVEWINTVFEVFDKNGNPLGGGPHSGEQLFQNLDQPPNPADVCTTTNQGDTLVLYDQLANRWVLSQFAFNIDETSGSVAPPFEQCVAVSRTADPTGEYCTYAFLVSATSFNDYGKIGLRSHSLVTI